MTDIIMFFFSCSFSSYYLFGSNTFSIIKRKKYIYLNFEFFLKNVDAVLSFIFILLLSLVLNEYFFYIYNSSITYLMKINWNWRISFKRSEINCQLTWTFQFNFFLHLHLYKISLTISFSYKTENRKKIELFFQMITEFFLKEKRTQKYWKWKEKKVLKVKKNGLVFNIRFRCIFFFQFFFTNQIGTCSYVQRQIQTQLDHWCFE